MRSRPSGSVSWLMAGALGSILSIGGLLGAQVTEPDAAPAATSQPTTQPDETGPRAALISGLIGSKHDFTQGGKSGRDLCLPCHTPHQVSPPVPRLDRRPETALPLRPYQGLGVELTGWSLLCLGCHDGVSAPDVYTSAHAITVAAELGQTRLGTRGLRSHPVGIRYSSSAEGYEPAAAVEAAGLLLPDGRIQCTTCHDAHNTHRYGRMLRISNERSRMCMACHRL